MCSFTTFSHICCGTIKLKSIWVCNTSTMSHTIFSQLNPIWFNILSYFWTIFNSANSVRYELLATIYMMNGKLWLHQKKFQLHAIQSGYTFFVLNCFCSILCSLFLPSILHTCWTQLRFHYSWDWFLLYTSFVNWHVSSNFWKIAVFTSLSRHWTILFLQGT